MKMMNAVFALDGVASAVIGRRPQTTLNIFAEADVFLLHFIAERHRSFDALLILRGSHVVEKPLEDGERLLVRERNDYVRRNVVGIDVEHQVRKNPKVERVLEPAAGRVHSLVCVSCFHGADGSELLGVVAKRVRAVLRVIDFFHQAGMRDGDVVSLEIVVNVNLPVTIDDVIAAPGKLQALELEPLCLLGNLGKICRERLGFQIEIHKDELFPGFTTKRHHAHGAAVEELDAFDIGSANQAAIQRVGPAVILAAEDIFAAAAESDGSRAMSANVAEGTQFALLVANDDDWLTSDIGGEKTLGVANGALHAVHFPAGLVECSYKLPGALENA